MIDIVIFFFILTIVQGLSIDLPFKHKIKKAPDAETAISFRRKAHLCRLFLLLLSLVCFIIYLATPIFNELREWNTFRDFILVILKTTIAGIIILFWYFVSQKAAKRHLGNISTFSKDSFIQTYPRYALFLRAFEDDDYSRRHLFPRNKFSEYQFMRLLKTRIRVCAVGMTKELDSPDGAIRVYVNDKTWQEDVLELMEKAVTIYIHVNDRESCVWEIEHTANMKAKTIFIVTDQKKYMNVRSYLRGKIDLPAVSPEMTEGKLFFFLKFEDNAYKAKSIDNNIEGYNLIAKGHIGWIYRHYSLSERAKIGWFIIFDFLLFFICLVFYVIMNPINISEYKYNYDIFEEHDNISEVFASVIYFIIFYLFLLLPFIYQLAKTISLKRKFRKMRKFNQSH